jgi:RNA polymerase sigma-70 factor (ECF subfamily)
VATFGALFMPSSVPNNSETAAARFEAAALPFMNALYNRALHLTRRPEDASDLVQETFLRAYRTFANFAEGTNCKAWLFTILYSIFVNKYHKAQREPDTVSIDEAEAAYHHELADASWDDDFAILAGAELDWQGPEVRQALDKLPEDFRAAVVMVDVEQLSYEEAAAVLNCPVGTLRSRLFRARRVLFVELRDYARKMGFLGRPKA